MSPIGVFDSGYGGLTILEGIRARMPEYDYVYLGDNARAPYGGRSFDIVYRFTLEAVRRLFDMGCPLVVLGCNTASAKALRSIQQNFIAKECPDRRVLGVIRPTTEVVGSLSRSRHIGILATEGTIRSESYKLEIERLHPGSVVTGVACPMWVPLIENGEYESEGADYFVRKYINELLSTDPLIDTIILGCTHYPLMMEKIRRYTPIDITLVPQGRYIAESLHDYLLRHDNMRRRLSTGGEVHYFTTENPEKFRESVSKLLHKDIAAESLQLEN